VHARPLDQKVLKSCIARRLRADGPPASR
jgi:hypothetical protein